MTTAVQRRRGTNTEHATFTGLDGEITVNTTTYTLHVHDGSTVGGIVLAKADGSNIVTSSIDINGGTIDGTVIGGSSAAAGTFTSITGTSANINGTVTADGLSVDGSTVISGTGPNLTLSETDTTDRNAYLNNGGGTFNIQTVNDAGNSFTKRFSVNNATGDISFYDSAGSSQSFYWDASAESLGIGITPTVSLQVKTNTTTNIGLFDYVGVATICGITDTGGSAELRVAGQVVSFTGAGGAGTEHMRIDSSGNVGIGTTSPAAKLEIGGAGEGIILASPDGTRYKITVANGGILIVTAV